MPLFEYKCTNCGKVSEFILKAGEAPTEGCGHCGEKRLERILYSKFAVGASSGDMSCSPDTCGMNVGSGCCGGGPCHHK